MNPSAIPAQQPYNTGATYTPYGTQATTAINNAQSAVAPSAQSQQVQAPVQKGNWFTHLLPTLGSIAAPVVGAALAPETGGLSLLASLALAGGGSAAGKAAEDVAQGQSVNPTDLLKSAAEGAGGQALGSGVSGLLGKVGGKIASGVGNAVDSRAAQAATDAASQAESNTAKGVAQDAMDKATAFKNNYGVIGNPLQRELNLGTNAKFVDEMGLNGSDPYDMQKISGGGLELNNVVNGALQNSKPIDMSDFGNQTFKALQKSGVTDLAQSPIGKALTDAGLPADGNLPSDMAATDVRGLQQAVGRQIGNYQHIVNAAGNNGLINTEAQSQLDTLNNMYRDLGDRLGANNPEVDTAVKQANVDPETQALWEQKYGKPLADQLTSTVNNAQTYKELIGSMQPYVQMDNASKIAIDDIENAPGTARAVARAKAAQPTPPEPTPSNQTTSGNGLLDAAALATAPATHGASLLGMVPHVVKAVSSPQAQEMADRLINSGVAKRVASAIPLALTGASQFITHAPDATPTPVNLNLGDNTMQPQTSGMDPNSLNSLLLQLASSAIANNNSAGSTLMGQILPGIQNSNVAQQSLTGAENAFQQAGGGQGGILGNLAKVMGSVTGNPASQYEQQRAQLINQLTPLNIPTSAVPDITGNNQSATNQFQTLQQMINARLNGGSVLGSLPH